MNVIYHWKCDVCGVHCQSTQERIGRFSHCGQSMRRISEDEYWGDDESTRRPSPMPRAREGL